MVKCEEGGCPEVFPVWAWSKNGNRVSWHAAMREHCRAVHAPKPLPVPERSRLQLIKMVANKRSGK